MPCAPGSPLTNRAVSCPKCSAKANKQRWPLSGCVGGGGGGGCTAENGKKYELKRVGEKMRAVRSRRGRRFLKMLRSTREKRTSRYWRDRGLRKNVKCM